MPEEKNRKRLFPFRFGDDRSIMLYPVLAAVIALTCIVLIELLR